MIAAELFHRTAAGHLAEGRAADARDACRAGLRVAPEHAGLNEVLGLAAYDLEEFAPAVHALEAASLFGVPSVGAQLALADCYRRFGLSLAATAVYDFLAEGGRCPVPLLPALAKGLGRVGRYALALGVCVRLVRLRPGYHPAWYGVAFYTLRLGRPPADAVGPLEAAVRLAPAAVPYRVALAAVLTDAGRPADAYPLVRDLPADAVSCGCLCRRLLPAFARPGDAGQWAAYRDRADRLGRARRG